MAKKNCVKCKLSLFEFLPLKRWVILANQIRVPFIYTLSTANYFPFIYLAQILRRRRPIFYYIQKRRPFWDTISVLLEFEIEVSVEFNLNLFYLNWIQWVAAANCYLISACVFNFSVVKDLKKFYLDSLLNRKKRGEIFGEMDSKKKFCSTQFYAFQLKLDTVILLGVFIGKTVKEMQMRPKMRPYFVSYLSNGLHICLDRNLNSQAQKDFI